LIMPRLITKAEWQCSLCKVRYQHKTYAVECQERCSNDRDLRKFRRIFPVRYRNDTKYIKHCVKCGERVLEYKYEFDGIETSRGQIIYEKSRHLIFDGYYCDDCQSKLMRTLCKCFDGRFL
jgi:hypothetical protein